MTPAPWALALTAAAARRTGKIIEDRTTLPVPGWRWVPEQEKKDE